MAKWKSSIEVVSKFQFQTKKNYFWGIERDSMHNMYKVTKIAFQRLTLQNFSTFSFSLLKNFFHFCVKWVGSVLRNVRPKEDKKIISFRFLERTDESEFVYVFPGDGCYSNVGMQVWDQEGFLVWNFESGIGLFFLSLIIFRCESISTLGVWE